MNWSQEFVIAIAIIAGLLGFLSIVMWRLGRLAEKHETARKVFLQLMSPASIVSLLILLGVLFLLGMAILDLDKGGVLLGMGKAAFARGLITYLFAVVTIGTAVVLVLSALLGTDKEKFDSGKEILGLLLGVFGTIVGFYFASEISANEEQRKLAVSSILLSQPQVARGATVTVSVAVQGGTPPYRYAVALERDLPREYPELARPDGWILKEFMVPSRTEPGVRYLQVGVQDSSGEKTTVQTLVTITGSTKR